MKQTYRAQKGFTLIELLIVVAIIGILAAIAIPAYNQYRVSSAERACLSDVRSFATVFMAEFYNNRTVDYDDVVDAASRACGGFTEPASTAGPTLLFTGTPFDPGVAPQTYRVRIDI